MDGSKAFKLQTNEGILWAHLFPQYYTFRRGCVWKSEHGAILPHGGGHRRATLAAPKGG